MSKKQTLSCEECLKLLSEYGTPEHVIRHCKAVTKVAIAVAEELNKKGHQLDLSIIRTAGLLHDIARVHDNHQDVGAEVLSKAGLDEAAEIVKNHMHHAFPDNIEEITELDMVCIGDRLVKEDIFVGIDERMEYVLSKIKDSEIIRQIVQEKINHSKKFIKELENYLSITIEEIVKENDIL